MNRFPASVGVLLVALLFGLSAVTLAAADDKEKEKPKNAPTLDDASATLTQTVDGKEKTTKLELKYALKVKGYFDGDGFNIEEVDPCGPAAKLSGGTAMMEKGDIIVEVEGKKIKSAQDYAKAINGAADSTRIKIKVRDVRSGNDQDFEVEAVKR
jgi:membrane-associated protease RseP (regulator of RpoE activity)